MSPKKRERIRKLVCIILAVLMLGSLVSGALIILVGAESSAELEEKLKELRSQQSELNEQSNALEESISENQETTSTLIGQKAALDQQMALTQQKVSNLNEQVQQYSLLIAEKQSELEQSLAEEERLNEQYRTRLRSMEENGKMSYWSILFKATSFASLLDQVDMIREIAESDQLMMEKIAAMSERIQSERQELEAQLTELESTRAELDAEQETLEKQRAEADGLLIRMQEEYAVLSEEYLLAEQKEDELRQQIKETETDYYNALAREERERIEAEARRREEEAAKRKRQAASSGDFLFPCAYSDRITDPYGMRYHPLWGDYRMHYGVDFATDYNVAVYATKSGTVNFVGYGEANGNYVTISHGDGYSSVYAHLTNYTVSKGDYVSQGEVIGYTGSTGWSSGPHLHFEILYFGVNVNPMNYVSMP